MNKAFYDELGTALDGRQVSERELAKLKHDLCKKHGVTKPPTNIDILTRLPHLRLQTKPMRSQSGVTPIAVMTKPTRCPHGKCTYCPGGPGSTFGDVPQSYTGNEPSTMRAIRNKYDPYLIVMNRLEQFILLGHTPDKVELIIQGGTFPALDKEYQESVIENCLKAMNDFGRALYDDRGFNHQRFQELFLLPADPRDAEREQQVQANLLTLKKQSTLEKEQERNEQAKIRCVGLTIETKPDWGLLTHGNEMLRLGCTRVELGVQTVYDHVLQAVNRGHTMKETYESFATLKDLGFKICAHVMPGLPNTSYDEDVEALKQQFKDTRLRPDLLKIYPCHVAPGTPLYYQWKKGDYNALKAKEAAHMIAAFKPHIPPYCRVQRVLRDVPTKFWADGVEFTNLRQYIHQHLKPPCKCIRCREPKTQQIDENAIQLNVLEYEASGGKEYFISLDDTTNDFIIGYCRLRVPQQSLRKEITKTSALIRELHVNGSAVAIGNKGTIQHRGYGAQLLQKAEQIAHEQGRNKIVVISGIGVRRYYRKKGYEKDGPYMSKTLS
ncbi:tRNA uridine(34) 5-carboxymethylaminomethyl modification radical SAM/GNAT enzyme Elp3 [Candidatus Woesearchaeota archaeon]|nr:tRNA uridine(34) 5-carboxymethylaminomethyl modification radical SAM/GNAT enzyme Elp3 [Candidatus Woesearchaeota archaeon]